MRGCIILCYNNIAMYKNTTINQAKLLRQNMTPQERKLWSILRNNLFYDYKFRRQVPVGNYVADFLCEARNLIIEIDGVQHNEPENIKCDELRSAFFKSKGLRVLRFWNNDVDNNIDGVCEVILKELRSNKF